MSGPCLCGDPACPSCGSPGAVAWEGAMEFIENLLAEVRFSADEAVLAARIGVEAVRIMQPHVAKEVEEVRRNDRMNAYDDIIGPDDPLWTTPEPHINVKGATE